MELTLILSFSLLLLLALFLLFLADIFKQPGIFAYILTGFIATYFLKINLEQNEFIALLSHLGVAFLLFIIGLHLELDSILRLNKKVLLVALGQIFVTALLGYFVTSFLGFSFNESLVFAIALTFSSTILIAKLMTDLNQIKSLHAKVDILILILQDIVAIFVMVLLKNMATNSFSIIEILILIGKGLALIFAAIALNFLFYKRLFRRTAKNPDVLFILALSFAFFMILIANSLHISIELGAFLAGLIISTTPFSHEIYSRTNVLKEFFLLFFFISLGASIVNNLVSVDWTLFAKLFAFILIVKPLIIYALMFFAGFDNRTSFLSSISMAQLSSFSLLVLEKASQYGIVSKEQVAFFSLLTLSSMLISSYLIFFSPKLFEILKGILPEKKEADLSNVEELIKEKKYDIVLAGLHSLGYTIYKKLDKEKYKILVIDFDPEVVEALNAKGRDALYGDIRDIEILNIVAEIKPKIFISTVPNLNTNKFVLKKLKDKSPGTLVFLTVNTPEESLELYKEGADYVILPHHLGGKHIALLVEEFKTRNIKDFFDRKIEHIEELLERTKLKHKH